MKKTWYLSAGIALLLLTFVVIGNASAHSSLQSHTLSPLDTSHQTHQSVADAQCSVNGPYPDSSCTPGAIFNVTADQVCTPGYSKGVRNVPQSVKNEAYAEYGITSHTSGQYEVDHFIPLELGGSNDLSNLWPEAASPTPGFHEKDKVENYLHSQVCSGALSLSDAQNEIASDWVAVYNSIN